MTPPQTNPPLNDEKEKKPAGMSQEAWNIYKRSRSKLEPAKVRVQMSIGVLIFIALIFKAFLFLLPSVDIVLLENIAAASTLAVVATGLAFSAGVELAYMLFTPGPDEAIDPLILGLSSTTLIIISQPDPISWEQSIAVAVFSASIIGLFWARKKLLD